MCGIAGQINVDPNRPVEAEALRRMADAVRHRGPDAGGFWREDGAGLAHRRLSIIDLSEAANQPLSNEDGSVWIVFNGEIYNFQELRPPLEAKGHVFRSHSDTEVLVHLYEEQGVGMLSRLRGMFAFAIWDAPRRRLFAARDRIGKKPFKYFFDGQTFVFASELKALRTHPDVRATLDERDVHQYLGFGYLFSPNTGFREIKKLPPAHYLILENGKLDIQRYWRLDFRETTRLPFEDCRERIAALLDEATRLRMISDVPIGAFLSGGVDSSAIVAFMARHSSQPVRTFSIGFDFESHNELPAARRIAALFKTDHTEHVVAARATEILPELVRLYEEPYADSSALPSYYLARMTRESVTVALNGDGGDENFFGYDSYDYYLKILGALKAIEQWKLDWLLAGMKALPGSLFGRLRYFASILQGLRGAAPEQVFCRTVNLMADDLKRRLYTDEAVRRFLDAAPSATFMGDTFGAATSGGDPARRAFAWDVEHYLADDLCVKMDLATMAHGLETRSPLLDHVFMEFCATIPLEWKYRDGVRKHIFKEALAPMIPREHLNRPKQGFAAPVHQWFRGELKDLCRDALLAPGSRLRSWFDPKALARFMDDHVAGRTRDGNRLWLLLTLELWLRETA